MNDIPTPRRLGDVSAMLRIMRPLDGPADDNDSRRRLLANLFRLVGNQLGKPGDRFANSLVDLSPRQRQTLKHLLSGDSEKQIAAKLALSRHTVHVYVKGLYRRFGASSRAELLSRWVKTE